MQRLSDSWRRQRVRVAFVPTMGALHDGHLSLVQAAKRSGAITVVSIFVNPIQFGPKEDFKRYPRDNKGDARLLRRAGVDVLFCPDVAEMFPEGFQTKVSVPLLSEGLCGKSRPGHFDGVATVVAKLFSIVRPTVAFFGQKDYQQCCFIKRMTQDLNLGVAIRVLPIVREKDGLAMSSRNLYLSRAQRKQAAGIHQALMAAREAHSKGQGKVEALRALVRDRVKHGGIRTIEYIEIVDADTLAPLKHVKSKAVLVIAVRIGSTRLIDNVLM